MNICNKNKESFKHHAGKLYKHPLYGWICICTKKGDYIELMTGTHVHEDYLKSLIDVTDKYCLKEL